MNTVGEGLDPPGGKGCDILGISAKTNRVHGRVKTLPYRNNETCAKLSNTNLFSRPERTSQSSAGFPFPAAIHRQAQRNRLRAQ